MSDFNITAYCEGIAANSDLGAGAAVCVLSDTVASLETGVDIFFLLFGGALVFMMQAGFAMLCAGSVRQKNAKNILLKNLLDACGGALGFFTVGYAFAFGGDTSDKTFIGNTFFALRDFDAWGSWFFQFAFAATAATIVAGSVAERCKMAAYLCYSVFLTGFVYPVVVHAVWSSNGFLSAFAADPFNGVGAIDFAGSGVVHMVGGMTALVAIVILGPRRGRFYDEDGNPLEEPAVWPPHSVALQVLGTFLLWFGWYGFNPGSALAIHSAELGQLASLCAVTTTLGAATGAVSCMFTDSILEYLKTGEVSYDVTCAMNGCLAGLVGITAGCAVIDPWAACIIGGVSGWFYLLGSKLLIRFRIDDAVDAVPVHLFGGVWGVFSTGLFATAGKMEIAGYNSAHQGWFFNWGEGSASANLLVAELAEIGFVLGWVTCTMTPFFYAINMAGMFRVDPLEEEVGLDLSHHRGAAYDLTGPKKEDVEELLEVRASRHGKVEAPDEVIHAAVAAEEADDEKA